MVSAAYSKEDGRTSEETSGPQTWTLLNIALNVIHHSLHVAYDDDSCLRVSNLIDFQDGEASTKAGQLIQCYGVRKRR